MNNTIDPARPSFFKLWSKEELEKECARLNAVYQGISEELRSLADLLEQHNSANEL